MFTRLGGATLQIPWLRAHGYSSSPLFCYNLPVSKDDVKSRVSRDIYCGDCLDRDFRKELECIRMIGG